MENSTKLLLLSAILMAIMAPYLTSEHPDGLESALEKVAPDAPSAEYFTAGPFPDYTFSNTGTLGSSFSIVVGTLLTLVMSIGLMKLYVKKSVSS